MCVYSTKKDHLLIIEKLTIVYLYFFLPLRLKVLVKLAGRSRKTERCGKKTIEEKKERYQLEEKELHIKLGTILCGVLSTREKL
ncbi:hypothetical protein AV530_002565 [Patagioenas fasciata monilis]|uniref:Uncharacterized protein n=1 Tax=Patagioenas fasciata monilis TaxID=372326 RepID=A0A1V4K6V3_PATFA|nr:hypothetical protein AV530_002565 [Patagioenas fasciata monilis]